MNYRHLIPTTLLLASISSVANGGLPGYSDQTVGANIDAVHAPVAWLHEFAAGGTVADFNGDGFQDIFFAGGGQTPDQLLINNQDGTFTDRAAEWGIALMHGGSGAVAADYDGDGDVDLFVTSLGTASESMPGQHKFYRNENHSGFVNIATAAHVDYTTTNAADGWGGAFGDYDLDGDLDLAVCGFVDGEGNRLFRNNGDGTFTDATASCELVGLESIHGFAPRFVDMDGDRYPELIWIGDFGTSAYFLNDGDGTFTNYTAESGTSHNSTEMGTTVADFNHDGRFDFYVTTTKSNNLYLNNGNNTFTEEAEAAGVADTGWGWATAAIDFDHDTKIDIVATSQFTGQYAYRNTSTGNALSFDSVGAEIGFISNVSGRGLSTFDYDNDGDQDVVLFPRSGPVRLLRNDLSGTNINWIRIFLDPADVTDLPPHGIGSRIEIHLGDNVFIGRIDGGSNYLSQSELTAHFGLGAATTIDKIRVLWSNGQVTTQLNVPANQHLIITPDDGDLVTGDVTRDGVVDLDDLLTVILDWGPCSGCDADLDGNNDVNVDDLIAVLVGWS